MRRYFEDNLRENGERLFFRYGNREYTYSQADSEIRKVSSKLFSSGVRAGDTIAVDLPNSDMFVFSVLACSYLGVTAVLLNHRNTDYEKGQRIGQLNITRVVDERFFDSVSEPSDSTKYIYPERDDVFIVMFTSGTTGVPKAAPLTYGNIISSCIASNERLNRFGVGIWQAVLPMYHIGGLQIVFRSIMNHSSFIVYGRFDATTVLDDMDRFGVTHISVVDKMLRDMIAADAESLKRYEVILMGGGPVNRATVSLYGGSNLYMTYGMTETCSQIATSLCSENASGAELLSGFQCRIFDQRDGKGSVGVKGPAVFGGYLDLDNGDLFRDGYFITGDTGSISENRLKIGERVQDMFISGGENIYPREIEDLTLSVDGIEEAAVIGVEDGTWGRTPVLFISGSSDIKDVSRRLSVLSKFKRPKQIFFLDGLPKKGIGKIDRDALRKMYRNRISVESVTVYRISQPMRTPFVTGKTSIEERESLIIEIRDGSGRIGLGECTAFSTDWYGPETIDSCFAVLRDRLIPILLENDFLHPSDVSRAFSAVSGNLHAKGSIEPACWDIYGKIVSKSLSELIGAGKNPPYAGAVIGIMSTEETLRTAERYVSEGYRRIKLKIRPGDDIGRIGALRKKYPELMISADCNRTYSRDDTAIFRELDGYGLVCIEEPIDGTFDDIDILQEGISTPISLDESINSEESLSEAMKMRNLRNINLKIGNVGGIQPALDIYRRCIEKGIDVWMGGMFETGLSKYYHAIFETLDGIRIPGDISASERYFPRDTVIPPLRVEKGIVILGEGPGLGVTLDRDLIDDLYTEKAVFERDRPGSR